MRLTTELCDPEIDGAPYPMAMKKSKLNFMPYNEIYNLISREEVLREPTVFNATAHSHF
jgi:hypothetical protein